MPRLNPHRSDTAANAATPIPPAPAGVQSEPLLVSAAVAAGLCGRSEASWWRDHAAGRVPAPVKLGGSTRWRVGELKAWVDAGCPDRKTWAALNRHRPAR